MGSSKTRRRLAIHTGSAAHVAVVVESSDLGYRDDSDLVGLFESAEVADHPFKAISGFERSYSTRLSWSSYSTKSPGHIAKNDRFGRKFSLFPACRSL